MEHRDPTARNKHLILYDGVCGLCNRLNNFVLARDSRALFHFASIQSEVGRKTLLHFHKDPDVMNTLYVVADYGSANPRILSKARATLFVGKELGGIWRLATVFGILPDSLLNIAYDVIAKNRYRLFGRYDTCAIPKPEYKNRFVGL